VYGDHAWLAVDDQRELVVYDGEAAATQSWAPVIPNTLLFDEEYGGFMGLVENFAQVIRGVEQPVVTGWDGYRAYELLVASQISITQGGWVTLPLDVDAAERAGLTAAGWPAPAASGRADAAG
jgi:predicted dehydrogenase